MEAIIINQQTQVKFSQELEQVITRVVDAVAQMRNLPDNTEVSIVLVDDQYIRDLNRLYRHQDQATDVLSFAMNEHTEEEPESGFEDDWNTLGDIVISLERAAAQSVDYGHSISRELGFLTAHGMLHLLGFDHDSQAGEKEMFLVQEKILDKLNLVR